MSCIMAPNFVILQINKAFSYTEKKILPLLSRISIVAHEKIVSCHTQIQDRFPRLSLADIFKKHLQIIVGTRI